LVLEGEFAEKIGKARDGKRLATLVFEGVEGERLGIELVTDVNPKSAGFCRAER